MDEDTAPFLRTVVAKYWPDRALVAKEIAEHPQLRFPAAFAPLLEQKLAAYDSMEELLRSLHHLSYAQQVLSTPSMAWLRWMLDWKRVSLAVVVSSLFYLLALYGWESVAEQWTALVALTGDTAYLAWFVTWCLYVSKYAFMFLDGLMFMSYVLSYVLDRPSMAMERVRLVVAWMFGVLALISTVVSGVRFLDKHVVPLVFEHTQFLFAQQLAANEAVPAPATAVVEFFVRVMPRSETQYVYDVAGMLDDTGRRYYIYKLVRFFFEKHATVFSLFHLLLRGLQSVSARARRTLAASEHVQAQLNWLFRVLFYLGLIYNTTGQLFPTLSMDVYDVAPEAYVTRETGVDVSTLPQPDADDDVSSEMLWSSIPTELPRPTWQNPTMEFLKEQSKALTTRFQASS